MSYIVLGLGDCGHFEAETFNKNKTYKIKFLRIIKICLAETRILRNRNNFSINDCYFFRKTKFFKRNYEIIWLILKFG